MTRARDLADSADKDIAGTLTLDAVNASGVITGLTVEATGDTAAGDNAAMGYTAAEGLILTGQGSTSDITLKNDADAVVFTVPTGTDDILFPDNAKAMFGAGSDLQIYHDGSNSNIRDNSGTGALHFTSNSYVFYNAAGTERAIDFLENDEVRLYFNGNEKLATTNTGIDVTGTVTADDLDVQQAGFTSVLVGSTNASGAMLILDGDSNGDGSGGDYSYIYHNTAGQLEILQNSPSGTNEILFKTAGTERMKIDATGAVTMPLQPAFSATINATQSNLAVNAAVRVKFAVVTFDNNSDFTVSTGDGQGGDGSNVTAVFTAPVTGKYQLNLMLRLEDLDAASAYYIVSIHTSNRLYRFIFDPDFGQDAGYWSSSLAVLADMDTSDTAFVSVVQHSGTAQTDVTNSTEYTTFSGYLVA